MGGSIRWGVYTVGGGGSIRWAVGGLYGGWFYTVGVYKVGGSIRGGLFGWVGLYGGGSIQGGLFGGDSIWYAVYRWGILFFFPFGYLGINYPSVLGDPEKCLTRSNMV